MTNRTQQEIETSIKETMDTFVAPAVAQHGGDVRFVSYEEGNVVLEMSGACSGCAGSTATLKLGIQSILTEMVPEVKTIQGFDDPNSTVDPYFTEDPFGDFNDPQWGFE